MKASYRLPFPVSVNGMFLNMRGKGRVKSPAYRAWIELAGHQLNTQRPIKFEGRVDISIDLDESRRGDADNRFKPVADLLVSHGVIKDDSKKHVRRVSIGWAPVADCIVHIEVANG